MAPPIKNIENVEAHVFRNDEEFAVSGFVVNFNVNRIPTCQIRLAVGKDVFKVIGKNAVPVLTISEVEEGDEIQIKYYHNHVRGGGRAGGVLFEGVVTGIGGSKASNASGTSVGAVLTCTHKLSLLGGLATMARAMMIPNTATVVYDAYRENQKGRQSTIVKTISGMKNNTELGGFNVGEYLVNSLEELYESEGKDQFKNAAGESKGRTAMPKSLAVLAGITVSPNMWIGLPTNTTNGHMKQEICKTLGKTWMHSNGWTLLSKLTTKYEGVLMPTATSAVIAPNMPLSKNAMCTVKAKDIFSINSRTMLDPIPIAGVRLCFGDNSNDKGVKTNSLAYGFIQWPDPTVSGVYEYLPLPAWAQLTRLHSRGKSSKPPQVGTKGEPQHTKNITVKDKYKDLARTDVNTFMNKVAKSLYNTRVWGKNSMTLGLPLTFDCAPGMVIKIDITGDQIAQEIFGDSILYGQVQSVSIRSAVGQFSLTANVAYIRNEAQNEEFGFDKHPLYDQYTMKKVSLFTD